METDEKTIISLSGRSGDVSSAKKNKHNSLDKNKIENKENMENNLNS